MFEALVAVSNYRRDPTGTIDASQCNRIISSIESLASTPMAEANKNDDCWRIYGLRAIVNSRVQPVSSIDKELVRKDLNIFFAHIKAESTREYKMATKVDERLKRQEEKSFGEGLKHGFLL